MVPVGEDRELSCPGVQRADLLPGPGAFSEIDAAVVTSALWCQENVVLPILVPSPWLLQKQGTELVSILLPAGQLQLSLHETKWQMEACSTQGDT